MDGGAWKAAVHGVAKGPTRLSDFTFTFPFPATEREMATHSSVLAWRIPGMGGAWQATVSGVAQSRTRLKQLSSHKKMGNITDCEGVACQYCNEKPFHSGSSGKLLFFSQTIENNRCLWGCGKIGNLYPAGGKVKWWIAMKNSMGMLKKLNIELLYDPEAPLLDVYPRETWKQGLKEVFVQLSS